MSTTMETMREGWILACPCVDGGILAAGSYNAGPAAADDKETVTAEDCHMQIVSGMNRVDYIAYKEKLTAAGYGLLTEKEIGQNVFADFAGEGCFFHVAYWEALGEIRVLQDNCSVTPAEFSSPKAGEEKTTLYQYALYYDKNNDCTPTAVNCGMMYILKLADNRLFVIDGGHILQHPELATNGMMDFMHRITGTPKGEKITIAAWFITHAHGDHAEGCAKLMNRYHDELDIQRMMYNFPSFQVRPAGYEPSTHFFKETLRKYYPEIAFLKPHTGQEFTLSDVKFEVLYTHEDPVRAENLSVFPLGDFNCTSTVLRLHIDGQTVTFLGDISIDAESFIARTTAPSLWKSDMVQIAHHCINRLDTLYAWIAAPIAILPNSYADAHQPHLAPHLPAIERYAGKDGVYYEGEATYGFQVQNGAFVCVEELPLVGSEYDGSGY